MPDELKKMQPHVSIHRSICGYSVADEKSRTYFTMTNMMGIFLFTLIIRVRMKYGRIQEFLIESERLKPKIKVLQVCADKKLKEL